MAAHNTQHVRDILRDSSNQRDSIMRRDTAEGLAHVDYHISYLTEHERQ